MKVKTNVQGSSLHVSSDEQKADFISHSSSYTTHPPSINEKKSKLNFFLSVGYWREIFSNRNWRKTKSGMPVVLGV